MRNAGRLVSTLASYRMAYYADAMRRLLILRHAKTERTNAGGDHARQLIERGRQDAQMMGEYLAARKLAPATALVSDATRTRETFEIVARALPQPVRTRFDRSLYLADPRVLIEAIVQVDDDAQTLLLIGHNPGLHELAYEFAGSADEKLVDLLSRKFPTCSLAVIEFDCESWMDAPRVPSRLKKLVTAKSLRPGDSESDLMNTDDAD